MDFPGFQISKLFGLTRENKPFPRVLKNKKDALPSHPWYDERHKTRDARQKAGEVVFHGLHRGEEVSVVWRGRNLLEDSQVGIQGVLQHKMGHQGWCFAIEQHKSHGSACG